MEFKPLLERVLKESNCIEFDNPVLRIPVKYVDVNKVKEFLALGDKEYPKKQVAAVERIVGQLCEDETTVRTVPEFKTKEQMLLWLGTLKRTDRPAEDVVDPESGEVFVHALQTVEDEEEFKLNRKNKRPETPPEEESRERADFDFLDYFDTVYKIVSMDLYDAFDRWLPGEPELAVRLKQVTNNNNFPHKLSRKDNKPFSKEDVEDLHKFLRQPPVMPEVDYSYLTWTVVGCKEGSQECTIAPRFNKANIQEIDLP